MPLRSPFLTVNSLHSLFQKNSLPKILDCSYVLKGPPTGYEIFLKEHLPTAQYFDIDACAIKTQFPHTYPNESIFDAYVKKLGIEDKNEHIVLYDSQGVFPAMRVWYLFKTFGHNPTQIQILKGGVNEWKSNNFETESGEVQYKEAKGNYNSKLDQSKVLYYNDILDIINGRNGRDNYIVVDARSSGRFTGQDPEPREGLSSGHMPRSKNIPFVELIQDGLVMKEPEEIKKIFESRGLKPEDHLVFSCGSGLTACVLARAADLIGYHNYTLYDGSWVEYASNKTSPIEKSL